MKYTKFEMILPAHMMSAERFEEFVMNNELCTVQDEYDYNEETDMARFVMVPQNEEDLEEFTELVKQFVAML